MKVPKGQRKLVVYVWASSLMTICYLVKCGAPEFAAFATAFCGLVATTGVTLTAERWGKDEKTETTGA